MIIDRMVEILDSEIEDILNYYRVSSISQLEGPIFQFTDKLDDARIELKRALDVIKTVSTKIDKLQIDFNELQNYLDNPVYRNRC